MNIAREMRKDSLFMSNVSPHSIYMWALIFLCITICDASLIIIQMRWKKCCSFLPSSRTCSHYPIIVLRHRDNIPHLRCGKSHEEISRITPTLLFSLCISSKGSSTPSKSQQASNGGLLIKLLPWLHLVNIRHYNFVNCTFKDLLYHTLLRVQRNSSHHNF